MPSARSAPAITLPHFVIVALSAWLGRPAPMTAHMHRPGWPTRPSGLDDDDPTDVVVLAALKRTSLCSRHG